MNYEPAFAPSEYEERIRDVKRRMSEKGFDLLICQDPANMYWLTGFDGWSFYTPQAVVLHLDDDLPYWFGRPQDAPSASFTSTLPKDHIVTYAEKLVHHSEQHPFDDLCRFVMARGWENSRIGVELDAHYYTARAHRHIVDGLPNAKVSDCQELVNWASVIKSPAEIEYMKVAGQICSNTIHAALEMLTPGVSEAELIADIYSNLTLGINGKHGDYASICPLIQVGEGTSTPHLTWTSNVLPDSGLVMMEIAGARRHYHACLTRTAHIGPAPREITDLTKAIIEGGDVVLDTMRPGLTSGEVDAVWQKVLKKHGYSKESRSGYSIGVGFPPDWGERTISLRSGDDTVLQPGMCFHFQSGVWEQDFGAAVSESIVVTENGCERLCDADRTLRIVS